MEPLEGPKAPIGVAHEPVPDGVIGVKSVRVGKSDLAQFGVGASKVASRVYDAVNVVNRLTDVLDRIPGNPLP